ncbi:MAG: hypothetical protein GXP55_20905 [Deltaproteobacteria bacterium]|nr:hypothetical protein [Deltaproteobacteria bacterium]
MTHNSRLVLVAAIFAAACSGSGPSTEDSGVSRDGAMADATTPTDATTPADATSPTDAAPSDAGAVPPGSMLLPSGVTLRIPAAPDVTGDYDCGGANVLCVPSEFASPQLAADAATAGDTVLVSAGSYQGFVVTKTGTAESPIRFIARPGVVIDSFPASGHGIVLRSDFERDFYVDYIQIVGFTIQAPPARCIYLTKAIASRPSVGQLIAQNTCVDAGTEGFVLSQMSRSVVEDNVILNAGNGSSIDARDHGIYLSNGGVGDSLIRRNVIMGSSTNGIHFNGDRFVDTGGTDGVISGLVLDGNIIIGNGQNGFNMDGVQQSLFINNVFYANSRHAIRGYAIDGAEGPRDIVVINNTFIENNSGVKLSDSLGGHVVFNNLFVDMRDEAIVVPSSDLTEGANVISTSLALGSLPADLEHATPAQIAAFDFAVTAAGRAELVNMGRAMMAGERAPTHDLSGAPRTGRPDVGAVEY